MVLNHHYGFNEITTDASQNCCQGFSDARGGKLFVDYPTWKCFHASANGPLNVQEFCELKLNKHDLGLCFLLDTKQHQP